RHVIARREAVRTFRLVGAPRDGIVDLGTQPAGTVGVGDRGRVVHGRAATGRAEVNLDRRPPDLVVVGICPKSVLLDVRQNLVGPTPGLRLAGGGDTAVHHPRHADPVTCRG